MPNTVLPPKVTAINQALAWMPPMFQQYMGWQENSGPQACDFFAGNPQEMAIPGYVAALQKHITPQNKEWFAYKRSEVEATSVVAPALQAKFNRPYEVEDILMTNGATGGLLVVLQSLVGAGDEVIFISPPWFFYEAYILSTGATPVCANISWDDFNLDLTSIADAITERTRLIIINSPHNPTGRIYPPETLRQLGVLLNKASERHGRRIYLLSDEAYREIVMSDNRFYSPTSFYDYSFMVYTYGKVLLTPGQRLGYVAISPEMPERAMFRQVIETSQFVYGLAFPNALLQHSLADIHPLSIDIAKIEERADFMIGRLREQGYEVHKPQGTFYLLPKAPIDDDSQFCDLLAEEDIFCLPGSVPEAPGFFRICLTASDEMIERAIPGFARTIDRVRQRQA